MDGAAPAPSASAGGCFSGCFGGREGIIRGHRAPKQRHNAKLLCVLWSDVADCWCWPDGSRPFGVELFYLLFGGSKAMHTCWLLFGKTEFVYAYCRYFLSWKMKRKIWVYLQSAHVYLQDLMQIQQQRQGPSSCITISKLRAPLEQRIHKTEE